MTWVTHSGGHNNSKKLKDSELGGNAWPKTTLLQKGDRAFMIEVEDTKKVIGKIEKDFELITKAHNLCLHLNMSFFKQ